MASSCPEALGPETEREREQEPWEFVLRKYVLMLATVVATVAYGVGFNPPGGVWQENDGPAGHRAGEPIVRSTNNLRYLVFFYCNAFALASSVLVIVLFLLLSIDMAEKRKLWIKIRPLRVLMVLDLISFMGAYAVGSCRDMLTTIYTSVLMAAGVSIYLAVQVVLASRPDEIANYGADADADLELEGRLRKVLMLLATFAVSIAYAAWLNLPGGFWDNTGAGHLVGDAILNDGYHKARLATFFICNFTAFMASLLIIVLLLARRLHQRAVRSREMFGCVLAALVGLLGGYAAGSSRKPAATAYTPVVVAAGLVCILFLPQAYLWKPAVQQRPSDFSVQRIRRAMGDFIDQGMWRNMSRSLLLLLTTFATAITYQAGLDPPGGVWQENGNGHLAGDPILLTMNSTRYKIFFYCNSVAFVASLVTVIFFLLKFVLMVHVVQTVMVLEFLGLIGAYAAGASRDISTSIYVMALGGAVLFYVVIHVTFFALEPAYDITMEEIVEMEKKRKLLYLLATLSMAMSYQAGLTPPGGFWLQDDNESGHQAGDPILLFSHPRHYKAFLYCNSVSFMVSVITMILLVNPHLYRPAIRGHALTLCTVAGFCCLIGAYAAGSTQHLTTSIGIFVLVVLAFLIVVVLLLIFLVRAGRRITAEDHEQPRPRTYDAQAVGIYAQRKHLMLLAILVAGVTYQAGLDPPGGVWQSNAGGQDAGGPAMQDSRRKHYLAFFYGNSTSFAASITIILLLLVQWLKRKERLHTRVMRTVVELDLLALLVAYTAGSSRDWKSSVFVAGLVILILAYVAIKVGVPVILVRQRMKRQLEFQHSTAPDAPYH